MRIVYSIDESFVQHLCVSITSLLYSNQKLDLNLIIVENNLSSQSKIHIENLKKIKEFQLDFVHCPMVKIESFDVNIDYISKSTYMRLFIHELIDDEIILYLDADTLVLQELNLNFNELKATDFLFGGVIDPYITIAHAKKVINRKPQSYINAGVLLMNLSKMRIEDFGVKAMKYFQDHGDELIFQDQDIINILGAGSILFLDPKYNLMPAFFNILSSGNQEKQIGYDRSEIINAINNPTIVHFCGKDKPWYYMTKQPFAKEYMTLLRKTSFKNYKYPDKTIYNMLKKLYARVKKIMGN